MTIKEIRNINDRQFAHWQAPHLYCHCRSAGLGSSMPDGIVSIVIFARSTAKKVSHSEAREGWRALCRRRSPSGVCQEGKHE